MILTLLGLNKLISQSQITYTDFSIVPSQVMQNSACFQLSTEHVKEFHQVKELQPKKQMCRYEEQQLKICCAKRLNQIYSCLRSYLTGYIRKTVKQQLKLRGKAQVSKKKRGKKASNFQQEFQSLHSLSFSIIIISLGD